MRILIAALTALVVYAGDAAAQTSPEYDVQLVGERVYALVRTDPPGLMFEANSTLIIGSDGVVVVDPGSNPASARTVLGILRGLTNLPVTHIINTHWHDDHILGNAVFVEAFPAARVIAHETAGADADSTGARFRKDMIEQGPGMMGYLQGLMQRNESMLGNGAMSDVERRSHEASIVLARKAIEQLPTVRTIAPHIAVGERHVLQAAGRTIEIRHPGRAHTRGDLVVYLPAEQILIAGDVISGPIPLVGSTSYPFEFGATVEAALALGPRVIIPGHGPVLNDGVYTSALTRMLGSLRDQVQGALTRGETLEQAQRSIDLSAHRAALAGTDPVLQLLFDFYVAQPAIRRAYELAGK